MEFYKWFMHPNWAKYTFNFSGKKFITCILWMSSSEFLKGRNVGILGGRIIHYEGLSNAQCIPFIYYLSPGVLNAGDSPRQSPFSPLPDLQTFQEMGKTTVLLNEEIKRSIHIIWCYNNFFPKKKKTLWSYEDWEDIYWDKYISSLIKPQISQIQFSKLDLKSLHNIPAKDIPGKRDRKSSG